MHTALVLLTLLAQGPGTDTVTLDKARFMDCCKGAWAGQMFGVCYGAPYEFRSNGKPITDPLGAWDPARIQDALGQDDCYVEMTFLAALEEHGIDIGYEEAGAAFAATKYPLWHASYHGRENIRQGIMPPLSGHPLYNRHADDIDFQIEADLFGIICPGLPQESNRLCEVFGHIMNYGDGVYGGMFVAGMYAAAYFESSDVAAVVQAGLACIPEGSTYHACISDVIAWHAEAPEDWLATWQRIETRWQDDEDCMPGNPFNIDAKLNGAYIAMGLLYGNGDLLRTTEIATRCGQDADCNPSNAAGVLGCMQGYSHLDSGLVGEMDRLGDREFIHTDYAVPSLLEACRKVAERVILRAGGAVLEEGYRIPRQTPRPPVTLEQWLDQSLVRTSAIPPHAMRRWNPVWSVVACGPDMDPGVRGREYGRDNVLVIHPVSEEAPGIIEATLALPEKAKHLVITAASHRDGGDYVLRVRIDGTVVKETRIESPAKWQEVAVDIKDYAGKTVTVRIEDAANNWFCEAAYLDTIEVQ